MSEAATSISLALLSHTNVGKTTLARTLLRRDIGAVMDRAHVTEVAESHVLMRTADGDELVLWDTPGFGDSVRLQRRLAASGQPVGWFLAQVWDRFADRAFWCSQQAMRAARDSADVVLYVANATEDPAAAGYVEPELRILDWLGKPALVLLNQLGTRAGPRASVSWQSNGVRCCGGTNPQARCTCCRSMPLRAAGCRSTRCSTPLQLCLDDDERPAFARLAQAWRERDLDVLSRSARVIAQQLARLARDEVQLPDPTLAEKVSRALQGGAEVTLSASEERARRTMLDRLDAAVRESTAALVALHGLTGTASGDILQQIGHRICDPARARRRQGRARGVVSSSGALGGLAADVAAGGLTFGAGAIARRHRGSIRRAQDHATLQRRARARRQHREMVRRVSRCAPRRRGRSLPCRRALRPRPRRIRGERPAPRWQDAVAAALAADAVQRTGLWSDVRSNAGDVPRLEQAVFALLAASLAELYPEPATEFARRTRAARSSGSR